MQVTAVQSTDQTAPMGVGSNRLVWVLNRELVPYTETFRGAPITVPPNNEKVLLMQFLAARRFLAQPKAPAESLPDGTIVTPRKALWTLELTDEERETATGKSKKELEKEEKEIEKAAANVCPICEEGTTFKTRTALKTHMTKKHPDRAPLPEEDDKA